MKQVIERINAALGEFIVSFESKGFAAVFAAILGFLGTLLAQPVDGVPAINTVVLGVLIGTLTTAALVGCSMFVNDSKCYNYISALCGFLGSFVGAIAALLV